MTNDNIKISDNLIKLPKIGWVKFINHRQIKGRIIAVTVCKKPSGKYYVSVTAEVSLEKEMPVSTENIGLDLGLKHFLTDSNGISYSNPKVLEEHLKKLAKLQRKLTKKTKGSKNKTKAPIQVARLHEKISNIRLDYLHKLSTKLINENQVICIEDLKITDMLKNKQFSRNISDVSWSKFVNFLEYKAEWYERVIVKVDTYFPSSQTCNICGYKNGKVKNLVIRNWVCPSCGSKHNRDENAAKNILSEGLRLLQVA